MKMTFRWFGISDPVTLEKISQIPSVCGIVSAVYDCPPGEVWKEESIQEIKKAARAAGLEFEVVESVPVPEDIKMGTEKAASLIENYCENIRRLGRAGIKVVCYNFMPVFDWLRSDLSHKNPDGSESLAYEDNVMNSMNPMEEGLSLPGWDESYTRDQLKDLLLAYKEIDEERLWENLTAFLKAVIPVAEESGVKMAIHPDDPPWGIFGLPRIITNEQNIERFLKIVDSPANGLTLCTGSLGADENNDIIQIIRRFGSRIHFAHLRNIKLTGNLSFSETGHPSHCGRFDMFEIINALYESGFDGYIRPDHGRMIWGESGKSGYGLYDRALGASYLYGLWEAVEKMSARRKS